MTLSESLASRADTAQDLIEEMREELLLLSGKLEAIEPLIKAARREIRLGNETAADDFLDSAEHEL